MVAFLEEMRTVASSERFLCGLALIAISLLANPSEAQQFADPVVRDSDPSQYTCASVRCVAHFINERQCIAWTDGCQIVARPAHDFGRYIARGFLVPQRSQNQRTHLLLSLDPPVVMATLSQWIAVSTCPRRREFECVAGSPPPAPPIAGPPIGPLWIDRTEIHASWAPAGAATIPFGCLSIAYVHTQHTGDLTSRRARQSLPIVSGCNENLGIGGIR